MVLTEAESIIAFSSIIPMVLLSIFLFILGISFKKTIPKIIALSFSGLILFINVLFSMVLVDEFLNIYPGIVESYASFLMVMKVTVSMAVLGLVLFAGLSALELYRFRRGYTD